MSLSNDLILWVLAINLVLSAALVAWQQRALSPLLEESCPGSGAHYWRHTLAALQLLLPLLLVLIFVNGHYDNMIDVFRTMLICIVTGHLLAISAIAKVIWRRLVPNAPSVEHLHAATSAVLMPDQGNEILLKER